VAGPVIEELLDGRRKQQHRRIGNTCARRDHRIGQQRHQRQQPLVLLQGDVVGGAVVEPGIEQCQQDQRREQHHQQPAAQAGRHAERGAAALRAACLPVHEVEFHRLRH